jgi:hypothetical protein
MRFNPYLGNGHQGDVCEIAKNAFKKYVYCIAVHLVITRNTTLVCLPQHFLIFSTEIKGRIKVNKQAKYL